MKKKINSLLITNNKYSYEKFKDIIEIIYSEEYDYMKILELAREEIHRGRKLLTHPLSGSIKPNETPFKSILIYKEGSSLDMGSLNIIEESILTARKFLNNERTPPWTEKALEDFRLIDLSLIENPIKNLV